MWSEADPEQLGGSVVRLGPEGPGRPLLPPEISAQQGGPSQGARLGPPGHPAAPGGRAEDGGDPGPGPEGEGLPPAAAPPGHRAEEPPDGGPQSARETQVPTAPGPGPGSGPGSGPSALNEC